MILNQNPVVKLIKIQYLAIDRYDIIKHILQNVQSRKLSTMTNENYLKFPSVLREMVCNGEIIFPNNAYFVYEPILAYRGIQRERDDVSAITRADFMSYAEKNIRRRCIDKKDPHYYGVSLFLNKASVENALKFPRVDRKIAVGHVYSEAGPAEVNEATEHVCWWLYENVKIQGFEICQG